MPAAADQAVRSVHDPAEGRYRGGCRADGAGVAVPVLGVRGARAVREGAQVRQNLRQHRDGAVRDRCGAGLPAGADGAADAGRFRRRQLHHRADRWRLHLVHHHAAGDLRRELRGSAADHHAEPGGCAHLRAAEQVAARHHHAAVRLRRDRHPGGPVLDAGSGSGPDTAVRRRDPGGQVARPQEGQATQGARLGQPVGRRSRAVRVHAEQRRRRGRHLAGRARAPSRAIARGNSASSRGSGARLSCVTSGPGSSEPGGRRSLVLPGFDRSHGAPVRGGCGGCGGGFLHVPPTMWNPGTVAESPMTRTTSPAERYQAAKQRSRYPQLTAFAAEMAFEFDDFQIKGCRALEDGHGVLVCAPTGAGKTVVGEFAVHLALAEGRKCFYTTPIKALSNQKYTDLVERYGSSAVGLLTGDTSINGSAQVVVMTTEVLRNMLYAGSSTLNDLGYVVLDEIHYLADRFRGAVWEEVILHLPEHVRIAGLSATVSNAEEFGEWLVAVRGDTTVVVDEHRPVPLWQHMMVGGRLYDLFADDGRGDRPRINPGLLRRTEEVGRYYGNGHLRGPR